MNSDEQNQVKGHHILLKEGQELFHTIHLKSESECISITSGQTKWNKPTIILLIWWKEVESI